MRRGSFFLFLGWSIFFVPTNARAIPAFARRYGVECIFCHDGFPKLNAVGQRFKERGFRLQKEDNFDVSRWLKSVPITVRAEGNRTFVEGADSFNTGFIKAISAGNLGSKLSYWVDDAEAISSGNASNTQPDNAWLRYEVLSGNRLYAKGGRFELDLPFTAVRSPHLFPYEIYTDNTGFETEGLGTYKDGLELGGDLPRDVHWSASVVKGHSDTPEGGSAGFNPDFFLRGTKRWDRNRAGAFAYFGTSTLAIAPFQWNDQIVRVGADLSVWIDRLNLYGVYMYGHNSNSLATNAFPSGTGIGASFNGGFVQADYQPKDYLALTLRLNVVSKPVVGDTGPNESFASLFPGFQLFIFEHGKVSFEYGFQNQGQKGIGEIQAEIAF
jgi:hypothetical protein